MKNFSYVKAKHLSLGKRGEKIACRFLKIKDYDILFRNYKVKKGEIDIVARDGETLCFIEVKTRKYSDEKVKNPNTILRWKQSKRIKNASKEYLFEAGLNDKVKYRYELIEIFLTRFRIRTVYHWLDNFGK